MAFGWFGLDKRKPNIEDQWYVVTDDHAPHPEDPALLIHVVDLRDGDLPSIGRRRLKWESHPATLQYFSRRAGKGAGKKAGKKGNGKAEDLRRVSLSEAGDVARLWGADWPPPHVEDD